MESRDLNLVHILLAVHTESADKIHMIKLKLQNLLLDIIKNDSIEAETKEKLLLSFVDKRKCPIDLDVFVLALSLLMASGKFDLNFCFLW